VRSKLARTPPTDLLDPPRTGTDVRAPDDPSTLPADPPLGRPPGPDATSRRVRRNRMLWALVLLVVLALLALSLRGAGHHASAGAPPHHPPGGSPPARPVHGPTSRLDPDWEGDGKPVTFAFGGDVNFPSGSILGSRLADDPTTALGPTVAQLFSGADLSMVNLESALTDGTCPDPPPGKQYYFWSPASAVSAFQGAGITLITNTNNHGEDCGPAGLQMALGIKSQTGYPIIGIGQNSAEAFTPYTTTINGEHIAIIAATQVIDSDLVTAWSSTTSQPGLASAYDVSDLVAAVQAARKTADTVIVYLHWGIQLDSCPDPLQEPLANLLVRAGADIVIGTHAHVLLGGGYLGSAFVDYGLGNFAFYNDPAPTNNSGALLITATGRHIDSFVWRPATIVDELPQPLSGDDAVSAIDYWLDQRACTDVAPAPGASLATLATETEPAPASTVAPLTDDG
jgi:hypothetical protein